MCELQSEGLECGPEELQGSVCIIAVDCRVSHVEDPDGASWAPAKEGAVVSVCCGWRDGCCPQRDLAML